MTREFDAPRELVFRAHATRTCSCSGWARAS